MTQTELQQRLQNAGIKSDILLQTPYGYMIVTEEDGAAETCKDKSLRIWSAWVTEMSVGTKIARECDNLFVKSFPEEEDWISCTNVYLVPDDIVQKCKLTQQRIECKDGILSEWVPE